MGRKSILGCTEWFLATALSLDCQHKTWTVPNLDVEIYEFTFGDEFQIVETQHNGHNEYGNNQERLLVMTFPTSLA